MLYSSKYIYWTEHVDVPISIWRTTWKFPQNDQTARPICVNENVQISWVSGWFSGVAFYPQDRFHTLSKIKTKSWKLKEQDGGEGLMRCVG